MIRLALAVTRARAHWPAAARPAFKEIGVQPALSPVGSGLQPAAPMRSTPIPKRRPAPVKKFSLWNDRQSRLFTDRARAVAPATS